MTLILITGGARSGKSDYAERLAHELGGDAVTFVATATADDDEMAERIARHRAERPPAWRTIEVPRAAAAAVREATTAVVLVDCLTLLASNALLDAEEDGDEAARAAVRREAEDLVAVAAQPDAAHARRTLIVVTNEVGLGIVPATRLGRLYRDALGEANRTVAAAADRVVMMVSGIPLTLR